MAQTIANRAMIHAGRNPLCPVGMSEVMRTNPRESQTGEPRVQVAATDVVLVERFSGWPAEHQPVVPKLRPQAKLLLHPPTTELPKRVNDLDGKGNGPA